MPRERQTYCLLTLAKLFHYARHILFKAHANLLLFCHLQMDKKRA